MTLISISSLQYTCTLKCIEQDQSNTLITTCPEQRAGKTIFSSCLYAFVWSFTYFNITFCVDVLYHIIQDAKNCYTLDSRRNEAMTRSLVLLPSPFSFFHPKFKAQTAACNNSNLSYPPLHFNSLHVYSRNVKTFLMMGQQQYFPARGGPRCQRHRSKMI